MGAVVRRAMGAVCFAVTATQGSSVVLTCFAGIRVNRESCTGCRRIRSKTCGITRICAVTVFTNIYWRLANRTENLPFGSVGLLRNILRAAGRIKNTLCVDQPWW